MSGGGPLRFQVSKTGDDGLENTDLNRAQNGNDGLRAFNASYGSLPTTSLDGIHPTISVTDPDGTRRGNNYCLFIIYYLGYLTST